MRLESAMLLNEFRRTPGRKSHSVRTRGLRFSCRARVFSRRCINTLPQRSGDESRKIPKLLRLAADIGDRQPGRDRDQRRRLPVGQAKCVHIRRKDLSSPALLAMKQAHWYRVLKAFQINAYLHRIEGGPSGEFLRFISTFGRRRGRTFWGLASGRQSSVLQLPTQRIVRG